MRNSASWIAFPAFLHIKNLDVWICNDSFFKGDDTDLHTSWKVMCQLISVLNKGLFNAMHSWKCRSVMWNQHPYIMINVLKINSAFSVHFFMVSEVISVCFSTLCDWLKSSRHFLNQSQVKPKPCNGDLHAHVFPRLFWLVHYFVCVCCHCSE